MKPLAAILLLASLIGCRMRNRVPKEMPAVMVEDEITNVTLHYVTHEDIAKSGWQFSGDGDFRSLGITFNKSEDGTIYHWVTRSHWQCPDGYKLAWRNDSFDSAYCVLKEQP